MNKLIDTLTRVGDDIAKDLSGYATRAAIKVLESNWRAAVGDGCTKFDARSMDSDIDEVINNLEALRLGLASGPMAEVRMRKQLGLPFDIPPFDGNPEHLDWVGLVRVLYPDIGPKEAFRLAEQEYIRNDGIYPLKDADPQKEAEVATPKRAGIRLSPKA